MRQLLEFVCSKGFLTGAGSTLVCFPLASIHPVLVPLVTALLMAIILTFWTGAVRVSWERRRR